jgi:hypothetical protein
MSSSTNMFTKVEPTFKPLVLQRGNDIVTVVRIPDLSAVTATEVSKIAATQVNAEVEGQAPITVPQYKADGAAANLVFHTEKGRFLLAGEGINPAIEFLKTKDNTDFPKQAGSATGGGFPGNPDVVTLIECIANAAKGKLYLREDIAEGNEGYEAQQVVKPLLAVIADKQSYEKKVAVHTDKGDWGTQCYITATKHIHCSYSALERIVDALQVLKKITEASFDVKIAAAKSRTDVTPEEIAKTAKEVRDLTNTKKRLVSFAAVPVEQLIKNSQQTYMIQHEKDDAGKIIKSAELIKAEIAYAKYGNIVAVAFNDLAVATMAENGAFKTKERVAELALPAQRVTLGAKA